MPAIYPVPQPNPASFLGQVHDYSVVFRGNGEAVISLRAAFTNNSQDKKDTVELRLPAPVKASQLLAFQVTKEPPCIRYANYPVNAPVNFVPTCQEYGEVDYFQPYYGVNLYQKAEASLDGDTLKVKLPKAVEKDKSGSYFVYFRASGFASKDILGGYNFKFETAKVNDSIQRANIGISVDADQYLKGSNGSVDYRTMESGLGGGIAPMAVGDTASKNSQLDQFYNQIGYGMINKNVSNLAPMESYKVTGTYADSRLKLYGKEISIGAGVLIVLIILVLVISKFVLRRLNKSSKDNVEASQTGNSNNSTGKSLALSFLASLGGAVFIAIYSFGLLVIFQMMTTNYYGASSFMALIVVILSFVIFIVAVVIPGIVIGIKRGWGWGVLTVLLTVIWLVVIMMILALYFFFGTQNDVIRPLMMGTTSKMVPPVAPELNVKPL
jgi:hypothetical protein